MITLIEFINDPTYVNIVIDICNKNGFTFDNKIVSQDKSRVSMRINGNVELSDLHTTHWIYSLRHGPYFVEELPGNVVDEYVIVDDDLLRSVSDIDIQIDTLSRDITGLLD